MLNAESGSTSLLKGDTDLYIIFSIRVLWSHIINNILLPHEYVSNVPGFGLNGLRLEHSQVTGASTCVSIKLGS